MGERKGTNKYYPPDYDPKKGGLNKFMGTHALRERARKLHLGIIIIRFEMPYNIWCEGCKNHIGMGVRYNAEKTKIGMYYSTPVYQFRMKCHLCDNHFEIKTDPVNLDYVIVSGARRQERRWDPTENGQVVPDDKQVIHKLADDAMFKLEHNVDDVKKMKDVTPSLSKLEDLQERWKDDYSANRALRDIFRTRKRELQEERDKDNEFLKKRSMDIPLLKESEDDAKVASLIRLQPAKSIEERQLEKRIEIDKKSHFPFSLPSTTDHPTSSGSVPTGQSDPLSPAKLPSQSALEQRRLSLGIKRKKVETETSVNYAVSSHSAATSSDFTAENSRTCLNPSVVGPGYADFVQVEDSNISTLTTANHSLISRSNMPLSSPTSNVDDITKIGLTQPQTTCGINQKDSPSLGLLSSLVSYSDDSDVSSDAGSDSETTKHEVGKN